MTIKARCTQADIRRAIKAAQREGLRIRGVKPDGTVLVDDGDNEAADVEAAPALRSKWADAPQ